MHAMPGLAGRAGRRATGPGMLLAGLLCLLSLPLPASPLQRWAPFTALRGHTMATGEQGRAVRHTTTVAEDGAGRIWIGEFAGVTRLDGDLIRRYAGANEPAMAEGYTHEILPLPDGDVVLGGDREGVLWWDRTRDALAPVALADGTRLTRINALVRRVDGDIWVAAEQGLFLLRHARRVLEPVPAAGREAAASRRIFDVQEMADGTVWLAAQPGLYRRAPGATVWEPVRLRDGRLQARLRAEPAWELHADPRGRLWVGLMREGVVVLDGRGGAWAPPGVDGPEGLHAGTTIRSFLWDEGRQRMLAGTDGRGLLGIDAAGAQALPINLTAFTGGRNLHVRALMRARDGRIWAATDRGVFHFDPAPAVVAELDASLPGKDPHEELTLARSVLVDGRGRLWLGQQAGIIQVLDPASGTRRVVQLPPPLDAANVIAMTRDGRGRVWVAGQGVAWVDEDSLAPRDPGPLALLPRRRYTDVASDGRRVWLSHNEGLVELDVDGHLLRTMDTIAHGLRTTRLNQLALGNGDLWVGSAEGVHRIDLARWRAVPVPLAGEAEGLDRYTASLLVTGRGIWTGSLDGIAHGPGARPRELAPFLSTEGREVRALLGDGQGGLWFTVNDPAAPLRHFDAAGRLQVLGLRQGLHPGTVFYRDGLVRLDDRLLVAATDTGAVLVDTAALAAGTPPAEVDLSPQLVSVWLDGEAVPPDELPADGRPLRLDHSVERLVVAFSAMDYSGAGLRRYSYRLEGLDSRWNDTSGSEPLVFYSRLPPGHYTLLMRTTSGEFPGREWITRLPLEVVPAWYQTTWSRSLFAAAALLLLLGLGQWRLHRIRGRQLRLEGMVAARTRQLEQANARLARLAGEDALTGLMSRRRALELLAQRQRRPADGRGGDTLVLLDLDHFKQINDTYGHLAGDAVLREAGARLRAQVREGDILARYGGEELLVVLAGTPVAEGRAVAGRMLAALRASPVVFGDQPIAVRASAGVSALAPGEGVEAALARADRALYRAKEEGRDRVCVEDGQAP